MCICNTNDSQYMYSVYVHSRIRYHGILREKKRVHDTKILRLAHYHTLTGLYGNATQTDLSASLTAPMVMELAPAGDKAVNTAALISAIQGVCACVFHLCRVLL